MKLFAVTVCAIFAGLLIDGGVAAEEVCLEEAAGVCLKYGAAPTSQLSRADGRAVQRGLKALGFYKGGVDGLIGPGSRAAIAEWRRSTGARASGALTQSEIAALKEEGTSLPAPPTTSAGSITAHVAAARANLGKVSCNLRTSTGTSWRAMFEPGGKFYGIIKGQSMVGAWSLKRDEFCISIDGRFKECRPLGQYDEAEWRRVASPSYDWCAALRR